MKHICRYILLLFSLFVVCETASAQICTGVHVQVYSANPQTGPLNEYGVRAFILNPYSADITVTGIIFPYQNPGTNQESFSVTIPAGQTEAYTDLFYTLPSSQDADVTVQTINPCPEIMSLYAGVYVTYETASGLLRFDNADDFNTVIDALDAAYETWNQNYENQYPNLTPEQLDDVDDANGFDEFHENRQFENLFTGFSSKRKQVEDAENAWLNSDFTTTNPSEYDQTADDALNTVMNAIGAFKIGGDRYELNASGFYLNGTLQASNSLHLKSKEELAAAKAAKEAFYGNFNDLDRIGLAGPSPTLQENDEDEWVHPFCKSNKKTTDERQIGNERYKLEVAIHSVIVRSSVKVKVVHFKQKSNGKFRRARAKLAVYLAGNIYDNNCVFQQDLSERYPSSGFKNRKQLKLAERGWGILWRTKSGDLNGSFEQDNNNHYSVVLTF